MDAAFREMIARNNWIVLDTETTGLKRPAEICQIAIINPDGTVLLDSLVKTIKPIPTIATSIHHITNTDVLNAPTWAQIVPTVKALIAGKDVITYNANYDRMMFHLSDEASGLDIDWQTKPGIEGVATWHCAMLWYAEFYGEEGFYGDWKWQKLENAARQQGIKVENAHNALGDCLMTLQIIQAVCAKPPCQSIED